MLVVGAWSLVALAWTPPTIFPQAAYGRPGRVFPNWLVFGNVLVGFVPWMAVTPLVLWLGARATAAATFCSTTTANCC